MAIEFVSYSITRIEAQEIYNTSNSIVEINTQLLRKLSLDADVWQLAMETFDQIPNNFNKFLLLNYRRIIGAVPPVTMWPGDMYEAIVFAKYWDMRHALPCIGELGIVMPGRALNKQDILGAIITINAANNLCIIKKL